MIIYTKQTAILLNNIKLDQLLSVDVFSVKLSRNINNLSLEFSRADTFNLYFLLRKAFGGDNIFSSFSKLDSEES